jgi:heat shock protein HtpX
VPDRSAPQSDERLDDLDAAVGHNRRVVRKLLVVHVLGLSLAGGVAAALVLALAGGPLGWAIGFGLIVGVASTYALVSSGEERILRAVRAEPSSGPALARVRNLVAALAVAAGVPRPEIRVVDDPAPNLMSVGRTPAGSTLVVTAGLVDRLDRLELEGVLAHEIGHIRRGDTEVTTLAAALVGWPLLTAESRGRATSRGRLVAPLLTATGPIVVWGLQRVVGWRREHLADLTAIRFTRYPPALISALTRIADAPPGPSGVPLATFPMWMVLPPSGHNARRADLARRIHTHPSIDERVEALAEL